MAVVYVRGSLRVKIAGSAPKGARVVARSDSAAELSMLIEPYTCVDHLGRRWVGDELNQRYLNATGRMNAFDQFMDRLRAAAPELVTSPATKKAS